LGVQLRRHLADGTTIKRDEPVRSSGLPADITALSLGPNGGLAIVADGTLWEWGERRPPAALADLQGLVRAVDADRTALALLADGTVRWWWRRPLVIDGAPRYLDDLPIGATKLGGCPDLPSSVPWPQTDGWPQAFVAQVDVRHLAGVEVGPTT
jgi:hypothetical protein